MLGKGFLRGSFEFVGQGNVAGGFEACYIGAMFVFHSEQCPHASARDFGEPNEKGDDAAMLEIGGVDGIEDPVEAEDGIKDHGYVVVIWVAVAADVAEEAFVCVWLEE